MKLRHSLALVALLLVGCKALTGDKVCQAIDLAHQTCPLVLKYADENGAEQTVAVSTDEAKDFAKATQAKHAAKRAVAPDAGAK